MPVAPGASVAPTAPNARGLTELEERVASGAGGVIVASVPATSEMKHALLAHVARCVRAKGQLAIVARAHAGIPMWRAMASRLSQGRIECTPAKCAEQI